MKLIVGLGNPGPEYAQTRHNAGYMAVDRLAQRHAPGAIARQKFHSITMECVFPESGKCLLMKPLTYMNRSGIAVVEAIGFYKLSIADDLLVMVDDVAIPVGTIRIRGAGSAGGHNGLADIERALGTQQYARLRIGVDAPGQIRQADYVLGRFAPEQLSQVNDAINDACDAAETWAHEGANAAMNRFNRRVKSEQTEAEETPGEGRTPDPGD